MTGRALVTVTVIFSLAAGCNSLLGNDPWTLATDAEGGAPVRDSGSYEGGDGASRETGALGTPDTSTSTDSGRLLDSTLEVDTAPPPEDTGPDVLPFDAGLASCLVVPDAASPTCSPINSPQACPSYGFCAIATSAGDAGRCTDCAAQGSCSGDLKSFCQTNEDCDDIFQCYCNQCLTLCILDSGECGDMCIRVGNDTWGVCMN